MQLTPKLREALQLAASAPQHRLVRCHKGFRPAGIHSTQPAVTRRTANQLVNAMLANFNDRTLPSAVTLTARGLELATAGNASGVLVVEGYATAAQLHKSTGLPVMVAA